jgi:hypothetical protein
VARLFKEVSGNLYTGDATSLQAQNRKFWVQLTAYDGAKYFAWTEMQPTYGGVFIKLDGGRFGTFTTYPAFCAEQQAVVPITTAVLGSASGTYVQLERAYFDASTPTFQWVWVFEWPFSPITCIDVMVDWQCVNGVAVITKKRICGNFTISDPPP